MENRIDPVTVANAAEDKRLAPIEPGQGGWVPSWWMPLAAAVGSAMLGSIGLAVTALGGTVWTILGGALTAAGIGLAGFFGTKSAGPRKE